MKRNILNDNYAKKKKFNKHWTSKLFCRFVHMMQQIIHTGLALTLTLWLHCIELFITEGNPPLHQAHPAVDTEDKQFTLFLRQHVSFILQTHWGFQHGILYRYTNFCCYPVPGHRTSLRNISNHWWNLSTSQTWYFLVYFKIVLIVLADTKKCITITVNIICSNLNVPSNGLAT
jgi:hypothetical protein